MSLNGPESETMTRKLLDDFAASGDLKEEYKDAKNDLPRGKEKQSFDFIFFRRLWRLIRLTHRQLFDWLWLIGLILTVAAQLVVGSLTGDVNKGFYDAFGTKDPASFRATLFRASLVVVGSAVLQSVANIVAAVLSWRWRRTIVHSLHQRYFASRMYYKVLNLDERIDNPDQRITQDVDNLTTTLAQVLADVLTGPMTIAMYTYQTWISIGWYAPAIVFGYFIISMILNKIIMGPIVNRVFRQERLEGDFRFAHVRVRTNAEAIAMNGGEGVEREHVNHRFTKALTNRLALIKWDLLLLLVNNFFTYFGSMVNFMVLAIPMLNGWPLNIDSAGAVALASFQVIMLISGYSKFNNVSQKVSDVAGYTSRVGQLFDVFDQLERYKPDQSVYDGIVIDSDIPAVRPTEQASEDAGRPAETPAIAFEAVSIWTPRGRRLVRNLRFQIKERQALLIMGPSGCGKSTILRTICGLWPFFSGTVRRPPSGRAAPQQVLFLPQSPYLTSGTLKDQIIYPGDPNHVNLSNVRLSEILSALDLSYLLDNPNNRAESSFSAESDTIVSLKHRSNREWIELLSPGEQQRLCLARVLFWRPRFVFLDEASSAIDYEIEKKFYLMCREIGCSLVSVGHSESLKRYHDLLLRLDHNSKWKITPLNDAAAQYSTHL